MSVSVRRRRHPSVWVSVSEENGACGGAVASWWRGRGGGGGGGGSASNDGCRRLAWLAEGLRFGD